MFALPGSAYVYQGEELGLPEVLDLPDDVREDPVWFRSGGTDSGRDGCRVPLPWSGDQPPFGFSTSPTTWLPQPASWAGLTADAQRDDPESTLSLYRAAMALRSTVFTGTEPDGRLASSAGVAWLETPDGVLSFVRGGARCVVNLSGSPYPLEAQPRLTSGPLVDGALPPDTAAWL
jgi:alpha-glucosidase